MRMVPSARSRTVLTLYTTADDVQCHRARLVLAAKGVSYERVLVDAARPPADLIDLNPYARSEEHTSELQSLMRISYAVFCLKTKTHTVKRDTIYNPLNTHYNIDHIT